jgi:hypothetical protein
MGGRMPSRKRFGLEVNVVIPGAAFFLVWQNFLLPSLRLSFPPSVKNATHSNRLKISQIADNVEMCRRHKLTLTSSYCISIPLLEHIHLAVKRA